MVTEPLPAPIAASPLVPAPSEVKARSRVPLLAPAAAVSTLAVTCRFPPAAINPLALVKFTPEPLVLPVTPSDSEKPSASAMFEIVTICVVTSPIRAFSVEGAGLTALVAVRKTAPERLTLSPPSAKFARPEVPLPFEARM